MARIAKWLLAGALLGALLFAGVVFGLQYWIASADFRGRVVQQLSAAVGVPVEIGRVSVDVWPVPAAALDKVRVASRPALTLDRIEVRPTWAALLQGRLEIATVVVRHAVLPEQAVGAIAAGWQKQHGSGAARRGAGAGAGAASAASAMLPRRVLLEQVTWVGAQGGSTTADADIRMDPDGLPASARVQVRQGRFAGARAALERGTSQWMLRAEIGGGSVSGTLQLQPASKGGPLLQAQLTTANVEISALTAPSRTLTGRLEARTTLRADLGAPGSLVDAAHSQTRFTVRQAVVHGVDLAQAVKSIGLSRGGETRLDALAGQLVTQGRAVQLNNLVATSGLLSAGGSVAMAANRTLSGRITVELAAASAGGALGVPLSVGGTLDNPSVTLTRGALLGAAIGTVIAPGVGTGAGVKLGDRIGEGLRGLFGK